MVGCSLAIIEVMLSYYQRTFKEQNLLSFQEYQEFLVELLRNLKKNLLVKEEFLEF